MSPRKFDHVVLPVESLELSRARYQALGFNVAADAMHPFGTENACIFFQEGTYLEPLAVGQREDCERSALEGNMFTATDQAYRFRNGQTGFSAIAFLSENAGKDRTLFKSKGISSGENLAFSRPFKMPDGSFEEGSFELTFARDLRAPDITLFCCQDVKMPKMGKSDLSTHDNGVVGIKEIVLSEFVPSDFQYYLQDVVGNRDTPSHSFGMEIAAANTNINVLTPEGMAMTFGVERSVQERGLRAEGLVLSVNNRKNLEAALKRGKIEYVDKGRYLVADRADGQGAFLAFDVSAA